MLYLYIVRHGETEWNKEGRMQGRLNSNLTPRGEKHAMLLGERLKDTEFAHIISSPSGRALETVQLIKGNRDIPIITDERIMEMNLGSWQGMRHDDLKKQYPNEYEQFINEPDDHQIEGAESLAEMSNRATAFLTDVKKSRDNGNLLVVTHGRFISALYAVFKEVELKDIWAGPTVQGTSLTIVKMDQEQYEVLLEADMGHIQGEETNIRS
jgi:broad specificity phosphatase PhoE